MRRKLAVIGLAVLGTLPAVAITTTLPNHNDSIYIPGPGQFTGVGVLTITIPGTGAFLCSGSLLSSQMHILTAGHCVTDFVGSSVVFTPGTSVSATFGSTTVTSTSISVNPGFVNPATLDADLALITLAAPLVGIPGYDIYRMTNEAGQVATLVGFGESGSGANGSNQPVGVKRYGQNLVDLTANSSTLNPAANGTFLLFDFDSGLSVNDATRFFFGAAYANLGLGNVEVATAPGDSGGPAIIGGRIAGVTSWGGTNNATPPDAHLTFNGAPDNSFGEIFASTRVSSYQGWIDSIVVPEPSTWALMGLGLAALAGWKKATAGPRRRG